MILYLTVNSSNKSHLHIFLVKVKKRQTVKTISINLNRTLIIILPNFKMREIMARELWLNKFAEVLLQERRDVATFSL